MVQSGADSAPVPQGTRWTLIRGARQLLTLRGANGPRRRSCLSDLSIIADGAVLIRDGIIHEVGTSRRVENIDAAGSAREIDASGKVVMPAFVDPDFALASPPSPAEPDIRRMSRKRLENRSLSLAWDAARYGVTTLGANTTAAPDLQNTLRALRVYRTLNMKPTRIRPIMSLSWEGGVANCAPAVSRNHLASIFEIDICCDKVSHVEDLARAAASSGCEIRFHTNGNLTRPIVDLTAATGCTSLIGSAIEPSLAESDCIQIFPGRAFLTRDSPPVREFVDRGGAIALASGYQRCSASGMNPQYLLYSSCNAGLRLEEAITATTHNAACALGVSRETGSLTPGKSADICIMDVSDYRQLAERPGNHDTWMVLCAGRIVYRRATPLIR